MLKSISNLVTVLSKVEQQTINGGLPVCPRGEAPIPSSVNPSGYICEAPVSSEIKF
ncbi:hypothetical protein [Tenacibaculum sp. nBUS_03]|uniref:hypothetical protein n=1 Tax=Tenacibaculum sp. nBUS_03 TaxID=3395320 RepID=UPI003EB7F8DD